MEAVGAAMGQDEGPQESAVEASQAVVTTRRGKAAQQEQSCEGRKRRWRRQWANMPKGQELAARGEPCGAAGVVTQRVNCPGGDSSWANHRAAAERTVRSAATPMVGHATVVRT
jgi:hypothetical protein